jgi:ParB-like chromosome segregation protein Spo0J
MPDPQPQTTYLRTADIPLDELTPFPGNAKRGDVDTIRASLRRNGQYRSLVVREIPNGPLIVLAGNHTLQALTAEGAHTARCEVVLCDDDTARRINLVDNRAAELGGYDNDALAELLSYMDGDLEGTGYSDSDIAALITPPPLDTDTEPALPEDPVYGVVVVCLDQQQQDELLERLTAEGRRVRPIVPADS